MHLPSLLTTITLLATAIAAPSSVQSRSTGWTIRNFSRLCPDDGRNGPIAYVFTIDYGEGLQECSFFDASLDASVHQFSHTKCSENPNYQISWGWNYEDNFVVMTVVYVPTQLEAFFGYKNPNANLPDASYPDVGPNPVQSTGVPPKFPWETLDN